MAFGSGFSSTNGSRVWLLVSRRMVQIQPTYAVGALFSNGLGEKQYSIPETCSSLLQYQYTLVIQKPLPSQISERVISPYGRKNIVIHRPTKLGQHRVIQESGIIRLGRSWRCSLGQNVAIRNDAVLTGRRIISSVSDRRRIDAHKGPKLFSPPDDTVKDNTSRQSTSDPQRNCFRAV